MCMKKILSFLLISITLGGLSACSSMNYAYYSQVGTMKSEDIPMNDDGSFVFSSSSDILIVYDFWSEYGKFSFTVMNDSDQDIYWNLSESFYINNGHAYDYYENKVLYQSCNVQNAVSVGSYSSTVSQSKTIESNTEKAIVCIPAHSYKVFTKYATTSTLYRKCGLIRDPAENETAQLFFDLSNSPLVLENRLVFYKDEQKIPIVNKFYLAEIQNLHPNNVYKKIEAHNCDGSKYTESVNIMASHNRYYIPYDIGYSSYAEQQINDRIESRFATPQTYSSNKKQ